MFYCKFITKNNTANLNQVIYSDVEI